MSTLPRESLNLSDSAAVALDEQAIEDLLDEMQEWILKYVDGVARVEKRFHFNNFAQALAFTNKVAELAEQAGHHPALLTEWGKVTVSWWSHSLGGVHRNDLIMAARTDQLS
ncbi:MAG: 4a-hydroxytetrahydrobiopterin dehydratase [Pseudomonas sp.]